MARILDQVIGHDEVIEKILSAFERGQLGHTNLFVGAEGIGKKLTALGLSQALLCSESLRACGKCGSCLRLEKGMHEGFKLLEPTGPQILAPQAREVLEFLNLKSLNQRRVIIIDQAHLMNLVASNILLKTLEEPPEGTYFFLIAPSAASMIPTIRSRSRVVQYRPLPAEEMMKKTKAPPWALKSARGSFEKLAQLQEKGELELRGKAVEILRQLINDPHFLLNESWRVEFKDRTLAIEIFSFWIGFIRDAICSKEGAIDLIVHRDQMPLVEDLSRFSKNTLMDMLSGAIRVEQALLAHRDPQLVMEEFYLQNRPL